MTKPAKSEAISLTAVSPYRYSADTSAPKHRTRCPSMEEIKLTVEQPELMNRCCRDHAFYLRRWDGIWLLVYAERKCDHLEIQCADWVEAP